MGERPFQGDSIATLMFNITTSPPVPLKELRADIPERLVAILEKLLAKDREIRYQQGSELVRDLAESMNP